MARGKFITFEGCEGAGKSTQIRRLCAELGNAGVECLGVREPGGTLLGEEVRHILKDLHGSSPVDEAELLLFLAARAQLTADVIAPALERGVWVVSDRFLDSTVAYQGYGRGMDIHLVRRANDFACRGIKPDVTVLLDIAPDVSYERMRKREKATGTSPDRIECAGEDFHRRVREGFLQIAREEAERFCVVDASMSEEDVWKDVWKRLKHFV